MKACSSTTFDIALMTESRIVAYWAFRSSRGTAIGSEIRVKAMEPLKIQLSSSDLGPKWQGYLTAGLGRLVDAQNELEGLPPRPAVGVGFCLSPQHRQDVPVVALMPQPVDVGRSAFDCLHQLVVIVVVGELPQLDLVDRRAADLHRPPFTEDGDRALEIAWVSEHGPLDGAECSGSEFQTRHATVLRLDAPRQSRRLGHHAF